MKLIKSYVGEVKKVKEDFDPVKELRVSVATRESSTICLGDVLRELKDTAKLLKGSMLLYYSNEKKMFIHCGPAEEADKCFLALPELQGELQLKYRKIIPSTRPQPQKKPVVRQEPVEEQKNRNKRTKERKIGEIINKVAEWRKLYSGRMGPNGAVEKYTLDEAAERVGIAKKTLDDYLLQIRAGKKYGFDFNIHSESKVGILRSFVKMNKDKDKPSDNDI